MKRLRYNKTDEGLISIPVLIKDAVFQGAISKDLTVTILNNKSEEVITLLGTNLAQCKRLVKREMRRLGANFLDEVRTKDV